MPAGKSKLYSYHSSCSVWKGSKLITKILIIFYTYRLVQVLFEKAKFYAKVNFGNQKNEMYLSNYWFLFKIGVEVNSSIKICYENQSDGKFKHFQKDFQKCKNLHVAKIN